MEQSSDSLFTLINSLTKAEKRYFRAFSGKENSGAKGYLVLFDIMSGMKKFDKNLLNKKIEETNLQTDILKTRQYLFDAIIKSLINYYSENDEEFRTRMQLMQLLVLNKKELFGLAQKKLKIFERNCARQNRTFLLAETYAMMKTNAFNLYLNNYDHESLSQLARKEEANLQILMKESRYRNVLIEMLELIKSEAKKSKEEVLKSYQKLESHPLLHDAGEAKTLRSKLIYLSINSILQFKLGKYEQALENASAYLSLIEKNKHLMNRNTFYYIIGLRNKILALRKLGRHKETQAVLNKLKDIKCHNLNQEVIKFISYHFNALQSFIDTGDFGKAVELIPEIEKGLETHRGMIEKAAVLEMHLLIAKSFFCNGSFEKAVAPLNRILSEPKIKEYVHGSISAKIMLMLSHYELKNYSLMPSLARSILRQMKMEGYGERVEYAFVKIFPYTPFNTENLADLSARLENLKRAEESDTMIDLNYMKKFLMQKMAAEEVLA